MSGYFSSYHQVSSNDDHITPPTAYQQAYTATPNSHEQTFYTPSSVSSGQQTPYSQFSPEPKQQHTYPMQHMSPSVTQQARPVSTASFNAPTHKQLGHHFRRRKQFRRHLWQVLVRLFLSVHFAGLVVALFHFYHQKDVLDNDQKHMFNAYFLALSLLLSLNTLSAFKGLMNEMIRWTVLSSVRYGGFTAQELDLVLQMSSYQTCMRLLKHWIRKKPVYFTWTLAWVALGIGAQVCLALLGLTFEQETDDAQATSPGNVNATDLTHFYTYGGALTNPRTMPEFWESNYMSHLYGEVSSSILLFGNPNDDATKDLVDTDDLTVIYLNETSEWQYNFQDMVYKPKLQNLYNKTSRYVKTGAKCQWSPIVSGQYNLTDILIDLNEEGGELWNASALLSGHTAMGSVTFLTRSANANETELENNPMQKNVDCGKRCGIVEIFRFTKFDDGTKGDYWTCNVTVSPVSNAVYNEHQLSDLMARKAATSIASAGVFSAVEGFYGYQYQIYTSASYWGAWYQYTNEEATVIAELGVAQFAAGSIAVMDLGNPKIEVRGARPWQGIRLEIKWIYVWINLGMLLGSHALVGLTVVFITNSTYCKDESYLSTARLLRPLVDRLGSSGSAATGDEIAELFTGQTMRYGWRQDGPAYHLDIIQDRNLVKRSKRARFPKGYYD